MTVDKNPGCTRLCRLSPGNPFKKFREIIERYNNYFIWFQFWCEQWRLDFHNFWSFWGILRFQEIEEMIRTTKKPPILIEKCAILLYSVCFIISNLYTLIGHSLLFFSNYTFPSFPYFFFKKRCQIHLVQNCIRNRINLSIFFSCHKIEVENECGDYY